jgi:hypothetical protein
MRLRPGLFAVGTITLAEKPDASPTRPDMKHLLPFEEALVGKLH